jgi:SAM-dependent methyltransferase
MGFVRANMIPILKEHRARPFSGRLLLFGQGDIYFSFEALERMARTAGVLLAPGIAAKTSQIPDFAAKGYTHPDTVFRSLGFSEITVLDYSEFEGADVVFDLNSPVPPPELEGQFDAIIDHGTLEHVFHFPNALNNIFRLMKVGGRAIISAPSGNFFDHGFYMFQPTVFQDYFAANGWIINSIQIAQTTPEQETEPPFFTDYEPGLFSAVSYGRMDNKLYATICIATKTADSTGDKIPQQGLYARMSGWSSTAGDRPRLRTVLGASLRRVADNVLNRLKR